jgi:thiosulfate/3-mercaptopyruvate sulfurtransferase
VPDVPSLLVDPAWLEERLGRSGLRIVDLRDFESHASAHVPGAVHLDLAALGRSVGECENVLVPPSEFGARMAGLGISNGDAVVAYDDQWGLAAARLLWALHAYGHDRVAVLDGGWDRWREEGRAVAVGPERVAPGRFAAVPREDVAADTEWILRRIEAEDLVLLDTRTRMEFESGHLPAAVAWDWLGAVPLGSWNVSRPPEDLRAEWRALGIEPSDEVVVYCRSGMRAAHTYLVLKNAGFARVRLYDGSWQAWSASPGRLDGD